MNRCNGGLSISHTGLDRRVGVSSTKQGSQQHSPVGRWGLSSITFSKEVSAASHFPKRSQQQNNLRVSAAEESQDNSCRRIWGLSSMQDFEPSTNFSEEACCRTHLIVCKLEIRRSRWSYPGSATTHLLNPIE